MLVVIVVGACPVGGSSLWKPKKIGTTRPLEGHPKIEDVAELKVSICSYETEEVTEELQFDL